MRLTRLFILYCIPHCFDNIRNFKKAKTLEACNECTLQEMIVLIANQIRVFNLQLKSLLSMRLKKRNCFVTLCYTCYIVSKITTEISISITDNGFTADMR